MRKQIKIALIILLLAVAIPIVLLGGIIVYSAMTEYHPQAIESAVTLNETKEQTIPVGEFSLTTYNIGYGGMDQDQDFFMDGGKMSRSSSLEKTQENMAAFVAFIEQTNSDAFFLQEVDESATRSHDMDQVAYLKDHTTQYSSTFAYNYKANWVPVPLFEPMGKAYAGLMTLSKTMPLEAIRYQLPGYEKIPIRYVDLKRCIMTTQYSVENGKTLYLINVHLSAFDKGGLIRAQQLDWLIDYITQLYDGRDNYVILGGDWNHLMSQEIFDRIEGEPESWIAVLPESLTATGFKLVFDEQVNSVRSAVKPYVAGENFETIIDGFLVSPNVEVISVKTHDLEFRYSDHQPVTAVFRLGN